MDWIMGLIMFFTLGWIVYLLIMGFRKDNRVFKTIVIVIIDLYSNCYALAFVFYLWTF